MLLVAVVLLLSVHHLMVVLEIIVHYLNVISNQLTEYLRYWVLGVLQ